MINFKLWIEIAPINLIWLQFPFNSERIVSKFAAISTEVSSYSEGDTFDLPLEVEMPLEGPFVIVFPQQASFPKLVPTMTNSTTSLNITRVALSLSLRLPPSSSRKVLLLLLYNNVLSLRLLFLMRMMFLQCFFFHNHCLFISLLLVFTVLVLHVFFCLVFFFLLYISSVLRFRDFMF